MNVTTETIQQVLDDHPGLGDSGYCLAGGCVDPDEAGNAALLNVEAVQWCADYLAANARQLMRPNPRVGSYWLKHGMERLRGVYVSNGELIVAAIIAGIPVRRETSGPNYLIGVTRDKRWVAGA